MSQKFKYLQVIAEALIPLLGFYFWDWGLYFILLFYFIDLVADLLVSHLKTSKIQQYNQQGNSGWLKWGVSSAFLFVVSVVSIHTALWFIFPSINFWKEAKSFWMYKELGIEQGYILVPLVFVMAIQQYKMEFVRFRLFEKQDVNRLWLSKVRAYLAMIGFSGLVVGLSQFIILPEWAYVIGIVSFVSMYSLNAKS